jgi:hypothetical protein
MAGKTRRSKLVLTDEDKAALEQLARSRTAPHREKQRAAILLGYYAGENIASIGRRLGMTRLSVSKWVAKALAVGPMAALKDNYHRPKDPAIGDDAKTWVVHLACSKPKDLGYAAEAPTGSAARTHGFQPDCQPSRDAEGPDRLPGCRTAECDAGRWPDCLQRDHGFGG